MAKRMAALHSAHQVCISTCQNDVLMVVGGRSPVDPKKKVKISKIRDVFSDSSTTSDRIAKWIAEYDSPSQISLNAPWNDVPLVVEASASVA